MHGCCHYRLVWMWCLGPARLRRKASTVHHLPTFLDNELVGLGRSRKRLCIICSNGCPCGLIFWHFIRAWYHHLQCEARTGTHSGSQQWFWRQVVLMQRPCGDCRHHPQSMLCAMHLDRTVARLFCMQTVRSCITVVAVCYHGYAWMAQMSLFFKGA